MASSEGQTELLTGWSCVVHQPSEDPEPSELPSTVDIAAFSGGLNVEPDADAQNDDCSDTDSDSESVSNNSGSDGSGSCSVSDSSDSDSSSSSSSSRSSSPEFSVTSQPNGLRLTIATVRKSCGSPVTEKPSKTISPEKCDQKTRDPSSSSDTHGSESESGSNGSGDKVEKSTVKQAKETMPKKGLKIRMKQSVKKAVVEKKVQKKEVVSPKGGGRKTRTRRKKMASLPLSRSSTSSNSESDDSEADSAMLASCSLQEIRQEDLAAILPDQQECDAFGAFEETERNSPQAGDASGSDMELPQQAVNALIQRTTESSSESESHPPPNPSTLYANSLLQQFVAQTQMLSTTASPQGQSDGASASKQSGAANCGPSGILETVKRKRGRPKKVHKNQNALKSAKKPVIKVEYSADPNVSPDSGIQNSPDHVSSPDCSPLPISKTKYDHIDLKRTSVDRPKNTEKSKHHISKNSSLSKVKEQPKLAVTSNSFDRILYGNTDRVLYPPRRKVGRPPIHRKGPGRPPKHRHSIATTDVKQAKTIVKVEVKKKNKKNIGHKEKESEVPTQISVSVANGIKGGSSKLNKLPHAQETCEKVGDCVDASTEGVRVKEEAADEETKTKDNTKCKGNKITNSRSVLVSKNKIDRTKNKYLMLKNAKLMHSKHKHKKHKKCKFKILKPVTTATQVDPKLNTEIEKLVQDFVKLCNISPAKPAKENVPEFLKVLKKVSKKRKTSEYGDRKKKKQNTTTSVNKEPSSNEQRLPLKKRHYHLTTSNDNRQESQTIMPKIEEDESKNKQKNLASFNKTVIEKKVDVLKACPQNNTKQMSIVKTSVSSPKVSGINNNEYEVTSTGSHIDEAIEACITKYTGHKTADIKIEVTPQDEKGKPSVPHKMITATTPKKRHRLEMANMAQEKEKIAETVKQETSIESVVSEIKMKRNLTSKLNDTVPRKTDATAAQMNTRKKNRLEDLTSNLVSKISETTESQTSKRKKENKNEDRATVIKYPTCKKTKPLEPDRVVTPVDNSSTGVSTPTVNPEVHQPAKDHGLIEDVKPKITAMPVEAVKTLPRIENRKKIRKRRAINRTGFPTVKRKKKKVPVEIVETKPLPCDRVPKDGEEYSSFVERTEKITVAEPEPSMELYNVTKWEVLSECDSLPQDERIDFDSLEVKQERLKNSSDEVVKRRRDFTPDTQSSDLDDLTLEARIRKMRKSHKHKRRRETLGRKCNESSMKTRLRDISPASSIEPFTEKRMREERASASGDEFRKNKRAPRWRKRYLVAGLFSDYFKEDDETIKQRRNELASKTKLVYNPQEHPYGLLPAPYHCGKYLRCRKIPFQLPHDLWWQHTHSQLAGRDMVPSWNYRKIRTNVYNVKNTTGACEPQSCNCSPQSGCGDDCINRLVLAECPGSHKCKNQKIQKHEWSPGIERFMTEHKGWGVKTNLPIKHGEFILEYVGEVVSDQEFKERMATRYTHDTHHYCLHLDGGLVIDGHRMGGDGRFVNHSCQPNCEMQKWSVNSQFRMALFALRDIGAGEELTYDYNFSLFNPAEGQECKCGSTICRGVIGGKSQRTRQVPVVQTNIQPGRVGRPRKNQAKKAVNSPKEILAAPQVPPQPLPSLIMPYVKPLSHSQKMFVLEHHCFLLRNLKKLKKSRDKVTSLVPVPRPVSANNNQSVTFLSHLNALRQPRNMRTRRLAQAEDDPELKKTVQLANVLRDIWFAVTEAKDEKKEKLSAPFMYCPSKRRVPDYYTKILEPIDLTMIEQNISSGTYKTLDSFDADMNKLFSNNMRFYGRTAELGITLARLKKVYNEFKVKSLPKVESALGVKPPNKCGPNKKKGLVGKRPRGNHRSHEFSAEEEDIIRCICGMYRDEGLMIQCERCLVWQHCECVRGDENAPSYHCEKCVPRKVDYEISMDEYTEHGHQYFMTLMRGDLQLRQGDTVYVLRDIPIPGTDKKHTYDTIGEIKYTDLDIFRIERLWKDCKSGQRFAYGHHYLRPHETYHEPTRKFFQNEVMRVPLYEAVPVELVISHCWVMDLNTYSKGRPIGAPEEHIYICEYRVDKSARLFSKVAKSKFPTCTKTYAFERFDVRLKITRTYTPHDLDPALIKHRGRKPQEVEEVKEMVMPEHIHIPIVRTRAEQKMRLNGILLKLLSRMPTKQVVDVSYLLEGGRRRKKHA